MVQIHTPPLGPLASVADRTSYTSSPPASPSNATSPSDDAAKPGVIDDHQFALSPRCSVRSLRTVGPGPDSTTAAVPGYSAVANPEACAGRASRLARLCADTSARSLPPASHTSATPPSDQP